MPNQKTPAPEKIDKTGTLNDGWGEGFDTCTCTTNCKCRKGQRATGWYQGTARNPEGEEIPVSGKLNTRWVLDDDISKDCGDHSDCKKDSNSSSDTETSRSKVAGKRNSKKFRAKARDDKLEKLKTEIDRMKKAARMKHRSGHLFAQFDCDLEPSIMDPRYPDPAMRAQLQLMRCRGDPYRTADRMGGMKAPGMAQGIFDSMTMRN
ncbi:hypothetical protein N0V94_000689 [Neodidymelliopsis sp. IMI 364377]|nr:hypothetical protein N0V94_000689 [Neodidymelliopsis sp. IMI 364377]